MISLNHLLQNPELYKQEMKKRFISNGDETITKLIQTNSDLKPKLIELDKLRQQKNEFNTTILSLKTEEKKEAIEKMKSVSNSIGELETQIKILEHSQSELLYKVPNLTWEGIPVGPGSDENVEIGQYGSKPEFDFESKHYYELPLFTRDYKSQVGVEASGFRGYYITGELARLQKALFDWALDRLISKGFEYVIPPIFVNESVMYGSGFFPTGLEDVYLVQAGDKTHYLPGTSEAALMFLYQNQILNEDQIVKVTAYTRCFRKEIGAYGKDTKGGIRVNQFEKIETVYICSPSQTNQIFEEMTHNFHQTLDLLGLYYHDLETSSGDNGYKNHRMIDIEAWFPASAEFRELASSSICTDYQTRNLNIRCRDGGETVLAHSLNCTGITNRTLFAILEQFQTADGRVKVPEVLVSRFGKEWLE